MKKIVLTYFLHALRVQSYCIVISSLITNFNLFLHHWYNTNFLAVERSNQIFHNSINLNQQHTLARFRGNLHCIIVMQAILGMLSE